jgi:hemerythrin-like domain-containing protein
LAPGQDPSAGRSPLVETLRGIVDLYGNHIWKEDAMVFPMADKILTPADQNELSEKFAEVDHTVGWDVISRLGQFAKGLGQRTVAQRAAAASAEAVGCNCGCGR